MTTDLKYMRRRLAAAKARALYWSGNPSFTGSGCSTRRRNQGEIDIQYEAALDDVTAWLDQIEIVTGERPEWEPPRERVARGMLGISKSVADSVRT